MFGAKSTTPIEHNIHAEAACIRAVFLLFVGVMNSSGDSMVKALGYLSISWSFKPQQCQAANVGLLRRSFT